MAWFGDSGRSDQSHSACLQSLCWFGDSGRSDIILHGCNHCVCWFGDSGRSDSLSAVCSGYSHCVQGLFSSLEENLVIRSFYKSHSPGGGGSRL